MVVGNLSRVSRVLLNDVFGGVHCLSTAGVDLDFPGRRTVILFAELGHVLGDEAALKMIWDCRGASGVRPCFICLNVVSSRSELAEYTTPTADICCLTCSDVGSLQLASNEEVWRRFDVLEDVKDSVSATDFETLQKASGQNYNADGVLADRALRRFVLPATVHHNDAMHCSVANGIAQFEVTEFFRSANTKLGVKYEAVRKLLALHWRWPRSMKGGKVAQLFDDKNEEPDKDFSADAGQMLQILPILRYFVENFVAGPRGIDTTGECAAEIESFIAMCDVVKILQACKHYGVTPARKQDLLAAARRHLQFFARVYGESCVKPKHHFMLHVAVLVNEWSVLLDCYVHERKHKAIKQAASQVYNTESFERSVLARVLLEQTRSLKTNVATFRPGLRETTMQALPRGSEGVWRCKRRRQLQPQMRRDEGRLGYVRGHVGASRALPGCRWRIGVAGPRVRCRCWPDFALAGAGCHILHLLEPVAPRSRAARVVLDL